MELHHRLDTTTTQPSEVWVGAGVLDFDRDGDGPAAAVGEWLAGRRLFIVSSLPILDAQGRRLEPLRRRAARSVVLDVPDGETAKSPQHIVELWDQLLAAGCKRDSRVVAFGGGSVGDLAGFAAATVLRGVEVAQVPTTLLAQVDAALGGKTGIDSEHGKNLIGAFHQPRFVLSDIDVLATLPAGERRSGLVEAVKKAALLDVPLFERIESTLDPLLDGEAAALAPVIAGAARAKLDVVERDAREGGLRKVLNYGHTLAHAIERQLSYRGLRHGEAVAYGILFANRLAARHGVLSDAADPDGLNARMRTVLRRFELPPLPAERLTLDGLTEAMAGDKKATEHGLVWVLPRRLGAFVFDTVPTALVRDELASFLVDPWAGE
ncbi:MAG: 3-dehydroquinate synthase [Acidobacteriota bacterium]